MTGHEDAENRLPDLLHETPPVLNGVLGEPHPERPSRRIAAAVAAVAAVLVVVAGVLAVADKGHSRPTAAHDPTGARRGALLGNSRLDQLAEHAPCHLTSRDSDLAGRQVVEQFAASAVIRCSSAERVYPGEGEWQVLIRQVSGSGLNRLLSALTRADQKSSAGQICSAIGYLPLTILLADRAGRFLHPRAPTTACGAPQPAVVRAIDHASWRTVSVSRIRQTRTADSISSGCDMGWKNENALYEKSGVRAGVGGPVFARNPDAQLQVCLYRTTDDPDGGTLTRSLILTRDQSRQLRAALTGGGPTRTCARQPSFAVIRVRGGQWVNLELGGCWRLIRNDSNPITYAIAQSEVVKEVLQLP